MIIMRATGIVRRIDDLGRIVVPKEIRKVLKIRVGDPLEIYTDRDGEIVLKKYSPIGEMTGLAQEYADAIAKASGYKVIITDRDHVVAVAGGVKRDIKGKEVARGMEQVMEEREIIVTGKGQKLVNVVEPYDYKELGQVICPIVCDGDIIGSVIILGRNENRQPGEVEIRLASIAAAFLGSQMESR